MHVLSSGNPNFPCGPTAHGKLGVLHRRCQKISCGKIYSSILFSTYTLPCFNELYNLFYISGKKVVPSITEDLLTPLSLAYWIADDGSWNKPGKYTILCTDSFALAEVVHLIEVLNKKFNLKCYKCRQGLNYRIVIPSYSIPVLQNLLASHMPPMMRHKIGL